MLLYFLYLVGICCESKNANCRRINTAFVWFRISDTSCWADLIRDEFGNIYTARFCLDKPEVGQFSEAKLSSFADN